MTEPGYPLGETGRGGDALRIARYRFKTTFRHRWGDYAVLVLLIGLIGGIAMGSVQAGRRTQSSYPAFLAKTNASDVTLSTYGVGGPGTGTATNYSPKTAAAIAHLPGVKKVESWVGVFAIPLERDGAPSLALSNDVNFAGSKGLYFDEDRVTVLQGHIPNPNRVNEFMTTALGASLLGAHVGQVIPVGLYEIQQATEPGFGTPRVPPALRVDMTLTGIVEFNNQVIEDDTDRLPTNAVYTPVSCPIRRRRGPGTPSSSSTVTRTLPPSNKHSWASCRVERQVTSASQRSPKPRSSGPSNRSPLRSQCSG